MNSKILIFFILEILAKNVDRMYPIHMEHSYRLDTSEIHIPVENPMRLDGFYFKTLRIGKGWKCDFQFTSRELFDQRLCSIIYAFM
jgi:hypothetical protein